MSGWGVVFPMAFPGPANSGVALRGEAPDDYVVAAAARIVREGFGAIELTTIRDADTRARVAEAIRALEVTFAGQIVQLQNVEGLASPFDVSDPDTAARRAAVERLASYLDEAKALGATRFALKSGADPLGGAPGSHGDRVEHWAALVRSLVECSQRTDLELVLVVFDRRANDPASPKAFKSALIGPLDEAVAVVEEARRLGARVALGVDTAHLLQNDQTAGDLAATLPYVGAVHVSNTVIDPKEAVRHGDLHPRFGLPQSSMTDEELASYAAVLADAGFEGPVSFEVRPIGDEDPWDVLLEARRVWEAVAR